MDREGRGEYMNGGKPNENGECGTCIKWGETVVPGDMVVNKSIVLKMEVETKSGL